MSESIRPRHQEMAPRADDEEISAISALLPEFGITIFSQTPTEKELTLLTKEIPEDVVETAAMISSLDRDNSRSMRTSNFPAGTSSAGMFAQESGQKQNSVDSLKQCDAGFWGGSRKP